MEISSEKFIENAKTALQDQGLQAALGKLGTGFPLKRKLAAERLPEFEALRDQARDIKAHVLDHLDLYLERYEAKVIESGGQVHWCRDAEEARAKVLEICRSVGAKTVTKGKSMIGEEMALNPYLEANGLVPVETDLGEYIIQLRNEPPSHIIAPAIHLSKEDVETAFRAAHVDLDPGRDLQAHEALLREARAILRERFLSADVGITGANFLIAETGTSVIVTNEGNGDLTQTLPKVHIVLASLEKIVPTLEDATTCLRVLARSATGQEMSVYTTFSTGPKRSNDPDGPDQYHVILLDNGRSKILQSEFRDILRCIRCSACLNHCPVYQSTGGHAYGWIYPGPMGSVLTPALQGIEQAGHLPNASTLCGKCRDVCPVRIDLPELLRRWRERQVSTHQVAQKQRLGLWAWNWLATRPNLYHRVMGITVGLLRWRAAGRGRLSWLPGGTGWTKNRDFPAPQGETFQQRWAREQREKS